MDKTPAEITSEHLVCRATLLAERMGLTAIMDSVERSRIQEIALDEMDDQQRSEYIALLHENNEDILDDVELEDERIGTEFRQAVGEIDGYLLAQVEKGTIYLVNLGNENQEFFRHSITLSFDTTCMDGGGYTKTFKAVTKTTARINEYQPITDDDRRIVATALERLDTANQQFGTS